MFIRRATCPTCGSSDVRELVNLPYSHGPVLTFVSDYYRLSSDARDEWINQVGDTPFRVLGCNACSLIFQEYAPDDDFAKTLYGKWLGKHTVAGGPAHPFAEYSHQVGEALRLTAFVLRMTGKESPRHIRVLDFGMGHGNFAKAMVACGCQVWGYDISDRRQEAGTQQGISMIDYAGIRDVPFDFINTEQVFEHLSRPEEIMRHLAAALAPRGLLKVAVPFCKWLEDGELRIDWSASRYAVNSYFPVHPLEHLNYFRRPSLEKFANRAGLKRVYINSIEMLNYSFGWLNLKAAARNVGRAFLMERFRNYFIFQVQP